MNMYVQAGKIRGWGRPEYVLLIGLIALSASLAGAAPGHEASLGIYSGWSLSLDRVFIDMTSGGHTFNHYMPNFVLGAYLQYDLSGTFALQLNANYQRCSNDWTFSYWQRHEQGTGSASAYSIGLNAIVTVSRSAMSRLYLLGGAGLFAGSFENLGAMFQLAGGAGMRLRLKRGSPLSLNLAAIVHPLLYRYGEARQAFYLKLQAGIEIPFASNGDGP
jgi:hypothetical protein